MSSQGRSQNETLVSRYLLKRPQMREDDIFSDDAESRPQKRVRMR